MHNTKNKTRLGGPVVFALILLGGVYFLPWNRVTWGKVELLPANTLTISGEARSQEKNQLARFSAGVDEVNMDKDKAISVVNTKITELIAQVKAFGVDEKDIKTQNMSIYQSEEAYWVDGRQRSRKGEWRVSNSVDIVLREVGRAGDLADQLANTGATNVNGPSFYFDDQSQTEDELLSEAVANARAKAEKVAKASGRKLGRVLTISEGGGGGGIVPMYARDAAGGGAPVEPGSSTIYTSATVVFELK